MKMREYFELSNGVTIPSIGYGTWQTPDGEVARKSVVEAIKVGYRHIDAVACYGNEVLKAIASKYNKSVAQLCIRWVLQHDVLPLPKSITASRIAEKKEVFDFEISAEDMEKIDALDNFGGSGLNLDEVNF